MDASMFSFYLTEFKHKRGSCRHLHHSLHQSIVSTNTHELSQSDTLNHFHTHSTQLFTTNKRLRGWKVYKFMSVYHKSTQKVLWRLHSTKSGKSGDCEAKHNWKWSRQQHNYCKEGLTEAFVSV